MKTDVLFWFGVDKEFPGGVSRPRSGEQVLTEGYSKSGNGKGVFLKRGVLEIREVTRLSGKGEIKTVSRSFKSSDKDPTG